MTDLAVATSGPGLRQAAPQDRLRPVPARAVRFAPRARRRAALGFWQWALLFLLIVCMFDIVLGNDSAAAAGARPWFSELRLILAFALLRSWAIARTCRRKGVSALALAGLAGFVFGAAVSVIRSGAFPTPIGYWEQMAGDCLLFVLILSTIETVSQCRFIARGLVFAGAVVSLVALYPVLDVGSAAGAYFTMINRLTFGAMNPNEYAYRLLVVVVLGIYLLVGSGKVARFVYIAMIALFVFSIALTYSRGAMIGAALAFVLAALLFVSAKRGFVSVALLLVIVALATPFAVVRVRLLTLDHLSADKSTLYRESANALAWQTIRSHPLVGVGGNEVNTQLFPGLGVHNGYLLLLCDGGLLEFAPLGFLLALAVYQLWRHLWSPGAPEYVVLRGAMAILVAEWVLILNATVISYAFWISLGLAWAVIALPAGRPSGRAGAVAPAFQNP